MIILLLSQPAWRRERDGRPLGLLDVDGPMACRRHDVGHVAFSRQVGYR